jgi:hypothetical protein
LRLPLFYNLVRSIEGCAIAHPSFLYWGALGFGQDFRYLHPAQGAGPPLKI